MQRRPLHATAEAHRYGHHARIAFSPLGSKGISVFAVPKFRPGAKGLTPNDVEVSGVIHKIGWKGQDVPFEEPLRE